MNQRKRGKRFRTLKPNPFIHPDAHGFSPANKARAQGATTLPKAGVKAKPERLIYRLCFCLFF
jgi:hypothetical protein